MPRQFLLSQMTQDELYIYRCLQLAEKGRGTVAPNPMVGAVLLHDGKIIGEGWTQPHGGAHAEVNCIAQVQEKDEEHIAKSTLYVSLEPCSHFGRTPPCVDLIIAKQIRKVIIGCKDTAHHVNGQGIEKLLKAGIDVTVGVLEKECIDFNKRFFTFQQKKRPFIILKWSQSADGFIAEKGKRTKITSAEIDVIVHKWRTEEAGIMIGTNTASIDDPNLIATLWTGKQPIRIVIDKKLIIDGTAKLYNQVATTIFLNEKLDEKNGENIFLKINSDVDDFLVESLERIYELGILSILVEGGSQLLNSFISQNSWDEARVIINDNLLLKDGMKAPGLPNVAPSKENKFADHTIKIYENK